MIFSLSSTWKSVQSLSHWFRNQTWSTKSSALSGWRLNGSCSEFSKCRIIFPLSIIVPEAGRRTGSVINVPMIGSKNSSGTSSKSSSASCNSFHRFSTLKLLWNFCYKGLKGITIFRALCRTAIFSNFSKISDYIEKIERASKQICSHTFWESVVHWFRVSCVKFCGIFAIVAMAVVNRSGV